MEGREDYESSREDPRYKKINSCVKSVNHQNKGVVDDLDEDDDMGDLQGSAGEDTRTPLAVGKRDSPATAGVAHKRGDGSLAR